jgi:hypothetical protein
VSLDQTRPEQLDENLLASDLALPTSTQSALERIFAC